MPHVIALTNQKGGVGKTTTTLNVGAILAQKMARVLLIDADPQASLTKGLGVDPAKIEYTVYEVLLNPGQGTEFATVELDLGLRLVPANKRLKGAQDALAGKMGREFLLKKALRTVRPDYDYILIDTPPNLGLLTANALVAAEVVIVPVQAHYYAMEALPELEETIDLIKEANPKLHVGGFVCTFIDRRTNLSRLVEKQLRDRYAELVFETVIPLTTNLAEAPAFGEPISVYAPGSAGAMAYAQLVDELERRYAK
jgi:chromosome partitioning protein